MGRPSFPLFWASVPIPPKPPPHPLRSSPTPLLKISVTRWLIVVVPFWLDAGHFWHAVGFIFRCFIDLWVGGMKRNYPANMKIYTNKKQYIYMCVYTLGHMFVFMLVFMFENHVRHCATNMSQNARNLHGDGWRSHAMDLRMVSRAQRCERLCDG